MHDEFDIEEVKRGAKQLSAFIARTAEAKPLIERLQLAILSRDVPAIDAATVEIVGFQVETAEIIKDLPGTEGMVETIESHKRLKQAILDHDETARAIAHAEIMGSTFSHMLHILTDLNEMLMQNIADLEDLED
jgi:hypothetical protein